MTTIRERAATFESRFPPKTIDAAGQSWTSFDGGTGETILLLTGGTGIAVAWTDLALALGATYRVIAVDYPPSTSFLATADGLAELLAAEGIQRAHLVGQSMGAMIAEVLSRRHPHLVASMTLSGAGLYDGTDAPELRAKRDTFAATPWDEVRDQMHASLRTTWDNSPDAEFWIERVLASTEGNRGRRFFLENYDAFLELIELLPHLASTPAWPGPVLVITTDDDPLMTAPRTERLLTMHPTATVIRYETGGHSLLLTRPEDYIREVAAFLSRVSPA